ncbi:MAG: hypothetical protein JJU02_12600 [Cryomorphaceae bacterium]|nr:hypothetical protein [Cryomorphaceae bacterium]
MEWLDFSEFENTDSKFTAELPDKGGYVTFSNSGKGSEKKYFTLSLDSFLFCLKDILNNHSNFLGHEKYDEKEWRDIGSKYFTDKTAKAQCTVQTKPMFATLSKIIMWANKPTYNSNNPEDRIILDGTALNQAVNKLEVLSNIFSPTQKLEKVKKNIKTTPQVQFDITSFIESLNITGLAYSNRLITRFISSLLSKPFVILTGLSGSGKTKLAQAFVQWVCQNESQYRIIPVGADWTNREPLLGYPNGLDETKYVSPDSGALDLILEASEKPDLPHFMILDEMNLSHVERYFADFLSIMESEDTIKLYSGEERTDSTNKTIKNEIPLPDNLFIIGTVNIDETTYMFSPKVLDRANVIEFRISPKEMKDFLGSSQKPIMKNLFVNGKKEQGGLGQNMAVDFLNKAKNSEINHGLDIGILNDFFVELQNVGAEFGYRSASEIALLLTKLDDDISVDEKIDIAIMQKLLPKLHGSRKKLSGPLESLAGFCIKKKSPYDDANRREAYKKYINDNRSEAEKANLIKYPLSFEKIERMYKNAIDNGFTSYAEA